MSPFLQSRTNANNFNSVWDMIGKNVKDLPCSVSISHGERRLTYEDLGQKSLHIGSLLIRRGIVAGDIVPILGSRTLEMIVSILAVIRIGACFVPIDIESWSRGRIDAVLASIEPKVVLTTDDCGLEIENAITAREIREAFDSNIPCSGLTKFCNGPTDLGAPVYIIFTSGTTGMPKGVMISHQSLGNYVQRTPFNLCVKPGDRVLLLFSIAFDACYGVLFSTLCNGGHLILSNSANFIQDSKKCTILPTTPTLLSSLREPKCYDNLGRIFLGGEPPNPDLVRRWWSPSRKLYNAYGPTETTISTSIAELRPNAHITLGTPITGSQMFLLNENLEEADVGEICITGSGLAIGYFKNQKITAEKFIHWKGQRLYRTSDLGKQTANGIEFLGRMGSLMKNRGFLINIDLEVIPALLTYPGVQFAAALMHQKRLVAFVSPKELNVNDIRLEVSKTHDSFLVPDRIIACDDFPKTSNGKLDIQALKCRLDQDKKFEKSEEEPGGDPKLNVLKAAISDALGLPKDAIRKDSSFWALGGNSLSAITLLSYLRQNQLSIQFSELFSLPDIAATAARLQKIEDNFSKAIIPDAYSLNDEPVFAPMTAVQAGMIRSCIKEPSAGYMLISFEFEDALQGDGSYGLKLAWKKVLERHAVFRTSFDIVNGEQKIDPHYEHDWIERTVQHDFLNEAVDEESEKLIMLTREKKPGAAAFNPINAFRLVTTTGQISTLLWLVHHSRIDGWSIGLIIEELRAALSGKVLPNPCQFATFACGLQDSLAGELEKTKKFWSKKMSGFEDGTPLNLPLPESPVQERRHGGESLDVGISLPQVHRSARDFDVSPAVIMYAAWALLLSCYTSKDQVVFGSVFSGRNFPMPHIQRVVGPLINTCPFPIHLGEFKTRSDLLCYIRSLLLQVGENQWFVANALQDISSGSLSSIFETILFLEYDLPGFDVGWEENNAILRKIGRQDMPEFGLVISVQNIDGKLWFRATYDESLFEADLVSRLLKHFRNLFLAILDPRVQEISEIKDRLLDPSELVMLIRHSPSFWDTYSGPNTLKDLFEKGVDQWPNVKAIESLTQSITYSELDAITNFVAKEIRRLTPPGSSVTILSNRTVNWLIAVLSVVKAGTTYVPLDTKLPLDRMRAIVEKSESKLCIFPDHCCYNNFSAVSTSQRIFLPDLLSTSEMSNATRLVTVNQPQDSAYLIFTSGSTGTPKGVRITHASALSYLSYEPARMHARPGRRHAQMFSPGFDVNIAEIFGTLCYGATLVLMDLKDPFAHVARVNATMVTPSFLSVCSPEDFPNLDTILFAGEAVPQTLCDHWSGNRIVYNSYGPCECTIGCLFRKLQPGNRVTLGRPIPRVGVYLLNSRNQPVPIGVTGEICLSGIQVADGYLGSEMETVSKSRFIPDPFVPGFKMYRTGDQGVWTESMELRFLGRMDNQVKVRGYRIELEEIENTIRSASAAIRQAAAVVHDGNIVAFVTPSEVSIKEIKKAIRQKLPTYAFPSSIFALPQFPTTPNQKLDRKLLKELVQVSPQNTQQPLTDSETLVASMWRETLGLPLDAHIDASTDFVEIGGNSLHQIKIAQSFSTKLGVKIPMRIILEKTVLSDLANMVKEYSLSKQEELGNSASFLSTWKSLLGPLNEVSYLEQEVYELSSASDTPESYNVASSVSLSGDIEVAFLEQAVQQVCLDNEIFRTCYQKVNNDLCRIPCKNPPQIIHTEASSSGLVEGSVNRPFELSTGPLIRVLLIKKSDRTDLTLVQHHVITDKFSINLFFKSVENYYLRLVRGLSLAPQSIGSKPSYAAWAYWKAKLAQNSSEREQEEYWKNELPSARLTPFTANAVSSSPCHGSFTSFIISNDPKFSGSLELFLATISVALYSVANVKDFVLGIPHIDRTEPGTRDLLGIFLDRLPIRVKLREDSVKHSEAIISSLRLSIHGALAHSLPYHKIRKIAGEGALFDIMVVYNRREDSLENHLRLPNVKAEEVHLRANGAKFPLLIEFTETGNGTVCEFEYMENKVSSTVIDRMKVEIKKAFDSVIEKRK